MVHPLIGRGEERGDGIKMFRNETKPSGNFTDQKKFFVESGMIGFNILIINIFYNDG